MATAIHSPKDNLASVRLRCSGDGFALPFTGAVAPGYRADHLVLEELENVSVRDVYAGGEKVVECGKMRDFKAPLIDKALLDSVMNAFHMNRTTAGDFMLEPKSAYRRVIRVIPGQLITKEEVVKIRWNKNNGIDTEKDI